MKKCFWEDREVYKFHNYVNNLATSKMNLHEYSQGSQSVYNRFYFLYFLLAPKLPIHYCIGIVL